jgi:hypothetical protein
MQLTAAVLGWFLLGQVFSAGDWTPLGGPAAAQAGGAAGQRLTAPQLVAEALTLPPKSALSGQPLSLLGALSSAADARQQVEVVRAYWRLVEAVSVYHFCFDYDGRLQQLQAQAEEVAVLRTAQASSFALLREVEMAVVAAQHDLAALVRLPAEAALPLPADRPHVGPYQTRFHELFAARPAPLQSRLIDRILPIRREAIEGRAAAVQAAADALAATIDARAAGRATLSDVLACTRDCLQQRQALIASVCRYNRDIADYVAAVGPAANAQTLVSMLLGPGHSGPAVPGVDSGVRPAGLSQPVPTPARRPAQNLPTPASKSHPPPSAPKDEPAPLPKESEDAQPLLPKQPVVPVELPQSEPAPTTVNKPGDAELLPPEAIPPSAAGSPQEKTSSSSSGDSGVPPTTPAMYPALLHAEPAVQAKQLTLALHWDRVLPQGIGEPIGLEDCLRDGLGADRRAVIDAFWLVRQRAAEYQVLAEQGQWLEELELNTPDHSGGPPATRLRVTRLANEAALQEARIALMEAQFELAVRIGRATGSVWPLASTVPHSGGYLLKLDAQPRQLAESWPWRRLVALIPGLGDTLQRQATAVVEADAARAAAIARYHSGGQSIEPVLAAIARQTAQTVALLQTLTAYNRAIAEYVLTVLPPQTPSDQLAREMTESE